MKPTILMNPIDTIERVLTLQVDLQQAWNAVATPEGISSWFCQKANFGPTVGEEMNLEWSDGTVVPTRIEKVDPPREFAFRWIVHGADAAQEMTSLNSTLITFTFEEISSGTRITLRETGFSSLAPELHGISRPEHEIGWTEELPKLEGHLSNSIEPRRQS